MVSFCESRKIDASPDRVWSVVSDVDRDSDYWSGLSSIQNIQQKKGNVIEREVVVGFMGGKGTQRITLRPKDEIRLELINGPLVGTRLIRLVQLGAKVTRVDVTWGIEFMQIPVFAQGFVKSLWTKPLRKHWKESRKRRNSRSK